jgi:hypothetical protein
LSFVDWLIICRRCQINVILTKYLSSKQANRCLLRQCWQIKCHWLSLTKLYFLVLCSFQSTINLKSWQITFQPTPPLAGMDVETFLHWANQLSCQWAHLLSTHP